MSLQGPATNLKIIILRFDCGYFSLKRLFLFFLCLKLLATLQIRVFAFKTFFSNFTIAFALIQCLRNSRSNLSISGPAYIPPPDPLTCIVPRAEDQAPGEEENLWQSFPGASSPLHLATRKFTSTSAVAL